MTKYYKITGPETKVSKTDKEIPLVPKSWDEGLKLTHPEVENWHSSFVPCEEIRKEDELKWRIFLQGRFITQSTPDKFDNALSEGFLIPVKEFEELVEVKEEKQHLQHPYTNHEGQIVYYQTKKYLVLKEQHNDEIPEAVIWEELIQFLYDELDFENHTYDHEFIKSKLAAKYKIFKNQH